MRPGFVFLDRAGTAQLMELTGNPVDGSEVATLAPAQGGGWLVVFEWAEIGWVDDAATNNLTWSIEGQSEGQAVLNRRVELLRRRGVMSATLVGSPEELVGATPQVETLLAGYRFRPGYS